MDNMDNMNDINDMSNIDNDVQTCFSQTKTSECNPLPKKQKKEKGRDTNKWSFIMTLGFILCAAMCISQSIYIIRLNEGRTGVMNYRNGNQEQSVNPTTVPEEPNNVVNPAYSIEEAASVSDPNKESLSTMEIARRAGPATVSVFVVESTTDSTGNAVSSGSGFIISEDGYVVTNAHVIDAALGTSNYFLMVDVPECENRIPAQIVGSDEQTDIAVLKLMEEHVYSTVILGDSDTLQVGELVVAIGNPLGTLNGTVTVGVLSAKDRTANTNGYSITLLQTDASINEGNSGGPLINSFGEVIGVTNAKMSSAEGLGFAIPISDVKSVIESLINYGYVANRPYLGITVAYIQEGAYLGAAEGVYIAELALKGPGENAGLKVGDRIVSFDGVEISNTSDIIDIRDSHEVGDFLPIVVERDGDILELSLRIGDSYTDNEEG